MKNIKVDRYSVVIILLAILGAYVIGSFKNGSVRDAGSAALVMGIIAFWITRQSARVYFDEEQLKENWLYKPEEHQNITDENGNPINFFPIDNNSLQEGEVLSEIDGVRKISTGDTYKFADGTDWVISGDGECKPLGFGTALVTWIRGDGKNPAKVLQYPSWQ